MGEPEENIDPKQRDSQGLRPIEDGGQGGGPASSRDNIEAVPNSGDRVYDGSGVGQSEPVPRTMSEINGGGEGGKAPDSPQLGTAGSHDPNIASKHQLKNAENQGGEPDKGKVGDSEGGITDKLGKGFTGGASGAATDSALPAPVKVAKTAARIFGGKKGFTKKKGATVGVAGLVASLLLFLFTIGVGPLKVIHLAEILQIGNFGNERSSAIGMRGLIRYAKTGNVGETRLTALGSELVKRTTAKLEKIGYDFGDTNKLTNGLRSATLDTSKNPELKNLSPEKRRAAFLKNNPFLDPDTVTMRGNVIEIRFDPTTVRGAKHVDLFYKSAIGELQNGKIISVVLKREFKKFYNLAGLFSPIAKHWKAKSEGLADKTLNKRQAREAAKTESDARYKTFKQSPVGARAADAKNKIKSNINQHRTGVAVALTFTGAVCIVKRINDVGPVADRADVAFAIAETEHQEAKGSKTKAGDKLTANDVSDWGNALENEKGEDVFKAKALQGLAGKENPSGEDLPEEEKQIFSVSQQADIESLADSVSDATCGPVGTVIQGVAGVALLFSGPAGWGVKAVSGATSVAASAVLIEAVLNRAEQQIADKVIFEPPFDGPHGGNVMAWASRASAGTAGRASGGVELSPEESAAIDNLALQQSREEFRSKSFASRIFDVYDYRSLASGFIQRTSINPGTNLNNLASSFMRVGSSLSRLISSIFRPVSAQQETNYSWKGLPQYGIPQKLFDDPSLQDPYKNAEIIAPFLDRYKDRARICFAANIEKDSSGKWDVTTDDETDPRSKEYRKAKCDDLSDPKWKRVILFVFYIKLAKAATCFDGNPDDQLANEICAELGLESGGEAPAGGEAAGSKIDLANLTKPSDNIDCAPNTKDAGVIDGYTGGNKVRIRLCEIPNLPQASGYGAKNGRATVNSRVSGAVYAMIEAAKKDNVDMRAVSTSRTMADQQSLCPCDGVMVARPGYSNHQLGVAIDFGGNGQLMDRSNPMWKWLNDNADKFDYKPYDREPWHWSPTGK